MCSLANIADQDEMPHNGSTLFAKTKTIIRERDTIYV